MKQLWTIMKKEIRDNLRDKRTVFFSLLYGPVLLPALMFGSFMVSVNKFSIDYEQPKEIQVSGMERAPNLIDFLRQNNLDAVPAPDAYREKIANGDTTAVLAIPEGHGDSFRSARPAKLVVHYSEANDQSNKLKRQLNSVLQQYSQQVRTLRYQARGIDKRIFDPLDIAYEDLSEEPGEAGTIGFMLSFLVTISMTMGGFYLAVDTTAGERERLSLEPLLSLPVSRSMLVFGKYLAIGLFVLIAMTLPLVSSYSLLAFVPEDIKQGFVQLGLSTFVTAFWVHLPLAVLFTSLLLAIASFTRSTKEAQTHLSLAMVIPMIPFFVLQFLDVPANEMTMSIPVLSQYKLMEMVVIGEALPSMFTLLSVVFSLLLAGVLLATTLWLFTRERIVV